MTRPLRFSTITCVSFVIGIAAHAWAQPPDSAAARASVAVDPPAHVSFVDGSAMLERDGRADTTPADMPLLAGDRIRTQDGRVEILFADGSTLHLDANTTVDFQSDELVRLLDGRIRLAIPGPDRQVSYRIDAPSASAVILQAGEYKLSSLRSTRDCDIELAVLRGAAELVNDVGRTPLRAGERSCAGINAAPSYAYAFNSAAWDSFDRWSEARRDQRRGISAQYLPDEVRPYSAAFDQYGTWQYQPTYGYVWYPRVAVSWRPYYHGRWVTLRPYGWTWIGADPFAWPTHHYGRWGFSAGAWFWIPGRTWGPAWVSWAYAPGYVSWCPLGWNNQAVIQINFFGGSYYPWHAWTVVPRPYFGVGYVHAHYVNHVAPQVWRTFAPRYTGPATAGYAVPRSAAPIRVPGTVAPRGSRSTVYTNLDPGASRVPLGGQRVVIGQPRSRIAPSPASGDDVAVRRGAPAGPAADSSRRSAGGVDLSRRSLDGADVSRRSPDGAEADQGRRSLGIARTPSSRDDRSDDDNVRRAVPRGTPMPSAPTYAPDRAAVPSAPGVNGIPSNRSDNPYGRHAPVTSPPAYGGWAVPRAAPPNGPGGGNDSRSFGGRPGPSGGDRPPQGPPPGPPPGGGDRRGSGTDGGQGAPPPSQGGAGGAHSRGGGQPTGGRAVPRGRG